jgi:hypothetical protein
VESFMKGMMISVLQGSSYLHLWSSTEVDLSNEAFN